jgi:hypothetical protein
VLRQDRIEIKAKRDEKGMRTIPITPCPARMRVPTGVKNGFYSLTMTRGA